MTQEQLLNLVKKAKAFETERQASFKVTDPATCKHSMVYHKQFDDVHCHFCDKFMYDASKD